MIFFTQYLEEATNHPLLTDYIFNKINFHLILAYFIYKPSFKEKNVRKYSNEYEYKSGKKILSCINAHVIDLLFKIKIACEFALLDEKQEAEILLPHYNFFSFLNDENSTKKLIKFKLPKYIAECLCDNEEWLNVVKKFVIPKIKKFEEKLLCNEPIKPKPKIYNEDKKIMKKEEESFDNYNDIYFWKMKYNISDEIKEQVQSKRNKNKIYDEEDELLMIAMELEK